MAHKQQVSVHLPVNRNPILQVFPIMMGFFFPLQFVSLNNQSQLAELRLVFHEDVFQLLSVITALQCMRSCNHMIFYFEKK